MASRTNQQVIDDWQVALSAGLDWPDGTVMVWLKGAIADFSIHMPPQFIEDISAVLDQHIYNLPLTFRNVVSVEFPQGEDPLVFLERRALANDKFFLQDGFYDVQDYMREEDQSVIWISDTPDGTETIRVNFRGNYAPLPILADVCPVPEQFHHVLHQYLDWRAMAHKLGDETQDPDTTTLLLSQLASNTDRARRAYHDEIRRIQKSPAEGGPVGPWTMDAYDRIY